MLSGDLQRHDHDDRKKGGEWERAELTSAVGQGHGVLGGGNK